MMSNKTIADKCKLSPAIRTYFESGVRGDAVALFAGLFMPFAFAPFYFFPLSFISLLLLLASWLYVSTKRAFYRGWCFGIGMYGAGVYWIYISIHTYGQSPAWFALLLTALFIAIISLFTATCGALLTHFFPRNTAVKWLIAFPTLWTIIEWCRSWLFTGFPWLFVGSSQSNSPLGNIAPFLSVYGVSFFTATLSAALLYLLFSRGWRKIICISYIIALPITCVGLSYLTWTHPDGKAVQVSLIQGNIAQDIKWDEQKVQDILNTYMEMTKKHWTSDIIIWPEAAIPVPFQETFGFLGDIYKAAKSHQAAVITGIPMEAADGKHYYNAAVVEGNGNGIYLKRHLVPFGEYFPLPNLFQLISSYFVVPMSQFMPGQLDQPHLIADNISLATFICYEITFPEEVRNFSNNAQMLLSLSDDAWFGRSTAQAQHLQMAAMRAMETGRYVLFSTNNGITAIINEKGKIVKRIPAHVPDVLTGEAIPMKGETPWVQYGMTPNLILWIILFALAIRLRHTQKGLT